MSEHQVFSSATRHLGRILLFAVVMASCTATPAVAPATLPAMKTFTAAPKLPASRPNSEITQDFLDLAFALENGRALPALSRFDGPITVRVTGPAPATLLPDLEQLLQRLRNEAGLRITLTDGPQANITIQAVPRRVMQRTAPKAACFVVPRISSWEELRRARNSGMLDWTTLTRRERVAIFVPSDEAPQEIRDCLHEEIAQSLGPLNDLYRLPDSVFNDDNFHAVLTGFDMLILRAFYAPELRNGMTRAEVAARLPALLARLNPHGQRRGGQAAGVTPREWITEIEVALTSRTTRSRRRHAAERAIIISRSLGLTGTREGLAHYAYGRLQLGNDASLALAAFNNAKRIYMARPEMRIHVAHMSAQQLPFALSSADYTRVIAIADSAIPTARKHHNAALLSILLMYKAEALTRQGDAAAQAVRLDSLGWARYGIGSDENVLAQLGRIASLPPD